MKSTERFEVKWFCHSLAVRARVTLHISYTMGRVFSSLPGSECHDEGQMKSCERHYQYYGALSTHLLPLFDKVYFQDVRFTWPNKHYKVTSE